jgi:uncharacterized repeat protein (TIGR03803 family)
MAELQGWRVGLVVFILFAAAIAAPAQTFNMLVKFDRANGANPLDGLVQGTDGNFYGTTLWGGADRIGTAFKVSPAGALTTLNSFTANPRAGLVLATDGNFYGTTSRGGGANVDGEVFRITPQGTLTTVYDFCSQTNCTDGSVPSAGLVQATDGNFYGTTAYGGSGCTDGGCGTIFKVTPSGALTTLHSFDDTDGNVPTAGLLQATNGDLYGTTYSGGALGRGTVFRITLAGTFTTLHTFHGLDGASPYAGLVQDSVGNLYGTTYYGGANECENHSACGTVFKISPEGTLTTLYSFCARTNCTDGNFPLGGVVQATDGNFYGTTYQGGSSNACNRGCGTIFRLTPEGALTTLHSFDGNDGDYPYGGLLQATNGTFYGTSSGDGKVYSQGTVYSLSEGLHPFVSFIRGTAKVGGWVQILGQGFVGTTSVSFNGTLAAFKVKSDTYLAAKVPQGTTTGFVTVTTPGGTLQSNVVFRVMK